MKKSLMFAVLALVMGACADEAQDAGQSELAEVVAPGKQDNYVSPTSKEFNLWGIGELSLEPSWKDKTFQEREAHVQDLLGARFKAYSHFINVYLTDKTSHDANHGYGGFSGWVRSSSLDWIREPVDEDGMAWAFIWELQIGAPRNLMDRLPIEVREDGDVYFVVKMPKLSESALLAGSYPKGFDPSKHTGELEDLEVVVEPAPESHDAWPDYRGMFDDGRLEVLIVVGGDYNEQRYDAQAAEQIFKWLKGAGFKHDAKLLADLRVDGAPFTRTLKAGGKDVAVEVSLVHPDIVEDAQLDLLRQRIVKGFQTADVVLYDGHAGSDPDYSGVVYHYNPRKAISATELSKLELPSKYQVYVFNGCKTYSTYPETVYKNPSKTTANLDIISTVSFAWLNLQTFTTSGFLSELVALRNGTHDPRTFVEILTTINKGGNSNVYYGVHGVDDNAHINPYADTAKLCASCTKDADCSGAGNLCVRFSWGAACGAECTANDGCPAGYACTEVALGGAISGRQCLPKTLKCAP